MSVLLSHPVCGAWLWPSQESHAEGVRIRISITVLGELDAAGQISLRCTDPGGVVVVRGPALLTAHLHEERISIQACLQL